MEGQGLSAQVNKKAPRRGGILAEVLMSRGDKHSRKSFPGRGSLCNGGPVRRPEQAGGGATRLGGEVGRREVSWGFTLSVRGKPLLVVHTVASFPFHFGASAQTQHKGTESDTAPTL